ncbi:ACT domain-containing protein [Raineyella sp. LH-20]|uniref:ACT domain-containing protein n=1 Tax=Raineyella sp. LH-20 TaxID=3081204 RepID=UPI0029552500|nr:ACT domain-containing protein [Raineyella sp. LH-20]WOP19455.1 ACT domain-containing protein [Raineyella sp. LH-20]
MTSPTGATTETGAITDLGQLLATLTPRLSAAPVVYTVVDALPDGCRVFATVRETEGLTLVLDRQEADRLGLSYDHVAALITLQVHSALEAVGLTAAVSTALAAHGISCNVIAGAYHDHLLVPWERRTEALTVLDALRPGAEPPR